MYAHAHWISVKCVKDVLSLSSVKCVFSLLPRLPTVKLSVTIVSDRYMEKFFMLHIIRPRLVHDWFRKTTIASLPFSKSDSPCS